MLMHHHKNGEPTLRRYPPAAPLRYGRGLALVRGIGKRVAIVVLVALMGSCNKAEDSTTSGADALVSMLRSVEPWRASRDYTVPEWDRALKVARHVQKSDPDDVRLAIRRFIPECRRESFEHFTGDYEDESKVFIVLRLVFDLPAGQPSDKRICFKGWTNWPETEMIDLGWPVSWQQGRPRLVARWQGSNGPYDALGEYDYLLINFRMRELDCLD